MAASDVDITIGGLVTAWRCSGDWCIQTHTSHKAALQHAQALQALKIANPVYIGTMPDITTRFAQTFPDLNPEGP